MRVTREANPDQDWREGPPEVHKLRKVGPRPPTKPHGSAPWSKARVSRSKFRPKQEHRQEGGSLGRKFQGRKHPAMGAARGETENAQSKDTKGATADRPPEVPDLQRVAQMPPPQGRREPTLKAEWEPLEI